MTRLQRLDWPDNGTPDLPPAFSLAEAEERLAAVRAAMGGAGLAALVIYGDREHAANLHWLTGFDPRFEEAVLVVTEGDALLIAGNECLAYTVASPLVAAGVVRTGLCASLSLPSQPRGTRRLWEWLEEMIPAGARVGAVGWKWYGSDELAPGAGPALALDIPAFLADPLRQRAGRVIVDFIDNGSGIPKDKQALIFEKFARLTDQTRAGGAGLGLAICREIMANLGGTITYLPGQRGAAFRVTLPLRLERQALA